MEFPKAWQVLESDIRRCLTNRFPFGIVYYIKENKEVVVLAVMQLNRKPNYWKDRI